MKFNIQHSTFNILLLCASVSLCEMLFAGTYVVSDEAGLRAACAKVASENVLILVRGSIRLTGTNGINLRPAPTDFVLVGVTPDAALDFNMTWDGNWRTANGRNTGGLAVQCRSVTITHMAFSGYQWCPASIWLAGGPATISDCTFSDIGTIIYPDRPTDVNFPLSTWSASVLHGTSDSWTVTHCKFTRCCWSYLGECLYIDSKPPGRVVAIDNAFDQCGNAFQTGMYSGSSLLVNNVVTNTHRTMRVGAEYNFPCAFAMAQTPIVFVGNKLAGHVDDYAVGGFKGGTGLHADSWFGFNDLTGLVCDQRNGAGSWWCDSTNAQWKTQRDWVALGADVTSTGLAATRPAN